MSLTKNVFTGITAHNGHHHHVLTVLPDLFANVGDIRLFFHFFQFLIIIADTELLLDSVQHFQYLGDLVLSAYINFEFHLLTDLFQTALPLLTDQNRNRKHDSEYRQYRVKHVERSPVKWLQSFNQSEVPKQVKPNEGRGMQLKATRYPIYPKAGLLPGRLALLWDQVQNAKQIFPSFFQSLKHSPHQDHLSCESMTAE
ncbi:hypothetical protein [Mucilaginibacter celer]|uniref:hypothetical protein n=1 Tax=Mucilaginibacter celer TaxID=2305508 RepID=UPI001FDF200D|nr:hypothetical protein [Mucilaginibacter celer]